MQREKQAQAGNVDPDAVTMHVPFKRRRGNADAKHAPPAKKRPEKRYSGPRIRQPRQVDVRTSAGLGDPSFATRYTPGKRLGEGSMGSVELVRDARIGREVAMKRMHVEHEVNRKDLRDRFLREARVQGQLEHPAVVPVYDLGVDNEGRAYFTMKRVRGHTMEEIIHGLRLADPEFMAKYSRRKLLTAMSRICLAISFAHERGVVHRDLKPANIMLGGYGEVHVLDWGIAKMEGVSDPTGDPVHLGLHPAQKTEAGFVVGTPGYMAPEQARGEVETYDGRSDIYSLGAILFELMTLERLHNVDEVEHILLSTVSGVEARPSVRTPMRNLPGLLDHICATACALNPRDRYQTARQMNDDLERMLDGDRDARRRLQLADEHARKAERALVIAHRGGPEAGQMHRKAVGELLAAMALEPDHAKARSTMVKLLLEPAERLPAEAYAELQEVNRQDRARAARENFWAGTGWLFVIPLVAWMGVRDWTALTIISVLAVGLGGYNLWMGKTGRTEPRYMIIAVLATFAAVGAMSTFFGPLFFVPAMAVATATSFLVAIRANRRAQALVLMGSLAAVVLPPLLELSGVVESSYRFVDGTLQILPGLTELPPRATWAFLLLSNAWTVVMANMLVGRAVEALTKAERRLFTQAWRLRQFLPELSSSDNGRQSAPAE